MPRETKDKLDRLEDTIHAKSTFVYSLPYLPNLPPLVADPHRCDPLLLSIAVGTRDVPSARPGSSCPTSCRVSRPVTAILGRAGLHSAPLRVSALLSRATPGRAKFNSVISNNYLQRGWKRGGGGYSRIPRRRCVSPAGRSGLIKRCTGDRAPRAIASRDLCRSRAMSFRVVHHHHRPRCRIYIRNEGGEGKEKRESRKRRR